MMRTLFLLLALGSAAAAENAPLSNMPANAVPAIPGAAQGGETGAMRANEASCAAKMGFNKPHYLPKLAEVRAFHACKVKGPGSP